MLAVFDLRQATTRHRLPGESFGGSPGVLLTPFHRAVAEVGRGLISDEVAALLPEMFAEAVNVVAAAASPRNVVRAVDGVYALDPDTGCHAAAPAEPEAVGELRATACDLCPTTKVVAGTALTVRLGWVPGPHDGSIVVIYLFEPADGGVLVYAHRRDPLPWFPL